MTRIIKNKYERPFEEFTYLQFDFQATNRSEEMSSCYVTQIDVNVSGHHSSCEEAIASYNATINGTVLRIFSLSVYAFE